MKILITGGCGFIGTNLLPLLKQTGHEVCIFDNLSASVYSEELHGIADYFIEGDIINVDELQIAFNSFKPDFVFHFAGLVSIYDCHKDPAKATLNNIYGTVNVLDAALSVNCDRVVFSESSAVYENCELHHKGFHETQSNPTTFYATTKASCALIADSYARTKGLKYTALRYFNVAGPIQDYKRTVPPLFAGFALRILGDNLPIIFGDGNRRRDFVHVDDVNEFHLQCLTDERTINETFNLGTGVSTSLYEIGDIIFNHLNAPEHLRDYDVRAEINGEAFNIYANTTKAFKLGWVAKKDIKTQIFDTITYLKSEINKGNIDPKMFMKNLNTNSVKI